MVIASSSPAGAAVLDRDHQEPDDALVMFRRQLVEILGPLYPDDVRFSDAVEQWRELVSIYFPVDLVTWALATIRCESRGNPKARNGSHIGLFQHSTRYWPARARSAGWAGYRPSNPEANIAVSAWLLLEAPGGGPGHWTCKNRQYLPRRLR